MFRLFRRSRSIDSFSVSEISIQDISDLVKVLTVKTKTNQEFVYTLDCSVIGIANKAVDIFLSPDKGIQAAVWADDPVVGDVIATLFNVDFDYILFVSDLDDSIIVPPVSVELITIPPAQYIKEVYQSFALEKSIFEYKQTEVKRQIDIYSASAANEVQSDLLVSIMRDVIKTNQELEDKYGKLLDSLLTVSTATVKPFDLDSLLADKAAIRELQIKYFAYKQNIQNQ